MQAGRQTPSLSGTFIQCTFVNLVSDDNGGAICYTSSGTLSVNECIFSACSTSKEMHNNNGGGAVFSNSSSLLSVTSSLFIHCGAPLCFGGGVMATYHCARCVIFSSFFFGCTASHGAGVTTHYNSSGLISSSQFVSSKVSYYGGGIYNNNYQQYPFILSDSLFTNNEAESKANQNRGGGAFEDYRARTYTSKYTFSFFARNSAPRGVGNDISIIGNALNTANIQYCFTTTFFHSFYNKQYQGYDNWCILNNNYMIVLKQILLRNLYNINV